MALILLAAAAGSVLAVRLPRDPVPATTLLLGTEQIRGFVYAGAGALAAISVAVVAVGLAQPGRGYAEALAVLGFFAYAAYLAVAYVMTTVTSARDLLARRWSAHQPPTHRQSRRERTRRGSGRSGPDQA